MSEQEKDRYEEDIRQAAVSDFIEQVYSRADKYIAADYTRDNAIRTAFLDAVLELPRRKHVDQQWLQDLLKEHSK